MSWLKIKPAEWLVAAIALPVIVGLQWLMVGKFWPLFANYSDASWLRFMRNFHMSGFDPITYTILTDGTFGYDVLRHPLLAIMLYPLYGLNQLLWGMTGANCAQLLMAVLLTFCAFYSVLFVFRILYEKMGVGHIAATLLACMFLGLAYIVVAMIVPDHFCLSLFMLLLIIYKAATKLTLGEQFTLRETVVLFVVTAGITLSNGAVALIIVLMVNGREFFRRRFFLLGVCLPAIAMLITAFVLRSTIAHGDGGATNAVAQQMHWVKNNVNRGDVLVENFFGESLQLHRKHVLGDVLVRRPVVVRYSWWWQYAAEGLVGLLLAGGIWAGRRTRLLWMLMAVFGFNLLLHLGLGFAIDEVHIMAAHWAFVVPLIIGFLIHRLKGMCRTSVLLLVAAITLYLWSYHGYLLVRYLTWPLAR